MSNAVRSGDRCGNGTYTFTRTCVDDDSAQTYTETVTVNCDSSHYSSCSPDVYINNRSSIHAGCNTCDDFCRPLKGSPNVFVDGFPKHRSHDKSQRLIRIDTDCDDVDDSDACCQGNAISGSHDVIVNG